ncbi:MAG: hypothetical protein AAF487_02810 [Bacteroidota bacterium]
MKNFLSILFIILCLNVSAQDEAYGNERIQKGLKSGTNYIGLTSGYGTSENEFLVSILNGRTVSDQVVIGQSFGYNSNRISNNEFLLGYFASLHLGKYQIKPVLTAKVELMVVPGRDEFDWFIGAKTSLSPGVSYLINEEWELTLFGQLSHVPFSERNEILQNSFLPRLEIAYVF